MGDIFNQWNIEKVCLGNVVYVTISKEGCVVGFFFFFLAEIVVKKEKIL